MSVARAPPSDLSARTTAPSSGEAWVATVVCADWQPVPKVEKNERQPSLSRGRSENGEASWRYEALTSPEIVEVLVDTYHRIVYPM